MKVPFHNLFFDGLELRYVQNIFNNNKSLAGDKFYSKKVTSLLQNKLHVSSILLTPSCTSALEMAVRLLDLGPNSEVILPSFTFASAANAVLANPNLKIKFADIEKQSLNIDPDDVVRKITQRTKALIVMHYAGVACDMDRILNIAKKFELSVIEDAAQALGAKYKNKYLGTVGNFGCYSFHDSKNVGCGEGGALCINNSDLKRIEKAEIMREKGTNRNKFLRGQVDKYTWIEWGSSYLLGDVLAAVLYGQLRKMKKIQDLRMKIFNQYLRRLTEFEKKGVLRLPVIPEYATHNAHTFYLLFRNKKERDHMLVSLRKKQIEASFHYVPLHLSVMGKRLGYKRGDLPVTENMSERLLRLPLYAAMEKNKIDYVVDQLGKLILKL